MPPDPAMASVAAGPQEDTPLRCLDFSNRVRITSQNPGDDAGGDGTSKGKKLNSSSTLGERREMCEEIHEEVKYLVGRSVGMSTTLSR